MNVDLRAMESKAQELRAKMRDVLTRKLGKPRKVDRTLDDLLRQMARRHKFTATLGTTPHMIAQLRKWRERHGDLEKKYIQHLNQYSDRLRLAAALQADILPQKVPKDPSEMAGGYKPSQYQRDVVRLHIIRSQQTQQIAALREEIKGLRLKPLSQITQGTDITPPESERSQIRLFLVPRTMRQMCRKYFPITPLGSQIKVLYDINVMKLIYDALDAMRVSRDDADELLKELSDKLPQVLSGAKSRFEVVDELVRKWLRKYGGDPSQYKKQTRAFDALAALADRLIRQHVETMEGTMGYSTDVMESLEEALKGVTDMKQPLHARLGPALAALFQTAQTSDLETAETMTSLINSLIDEQHPLTSESIDHINIADVVDDIKECGVNVPEEDLKHVIALAMDCLKAQIIGSVESAKLDMEVKNALAGISQVTTERTTVPDSAETDTLTRRRVTTTSTNQICSPQCTPDVLKHQEGISDEPDENDID